MSHMTKKNHFFIRLLLFLILMDAIVKILLSIRVFMQESGFISTSVQFSLFSLQHLAYGVINLILAISIYWILRWKKKGVFGMIAMIVLRDGLAPINGYWDIVYLVFMMCVLTFITLSLRCDLK